MTERRKALLERARMEIAQSAIQGLSFKTRKEILRELGPVSNTGTLGPGLIHRTRICCEIVKPALPIWESHYGSKDPHRMVDLAERYTAEGCSFDELWEEADSFRGGLDTTDAADKQVAYQVGRGAVCAAFVAASDEILYVEQGMALSELEDPEDPDHWDCAYWIAAAQAGGMPWEPGFDKTKYGAFWNWYLTIALPPP